MSDTQGGSLGLVTLEDSHVFTGRWADEETDIRQTDMRRNGHVDIWIGGHLSRQICGQTGRSVAHLIHGTLTRRHTGHIQE